MSNLSCHVETQQITETTIHVKQRHLEEFIKEAYGKVPNIKGDLYWHGREVDLQIPDLLEYDELEKLTCWKEGDNVEGITCILLKDMLNRSLILPGIYFIWPS